MPTEPRFQWRDVAEIAVGAFIMAFPVAATEEIWNLGAELSLGRVLIFAVTSVLILALLINRIYGHNRFPLTHKTFVLRVVSTYGVTLLISALLLLGLDRLELFQDPLIALKRTILVALPASFAATAVDSLPNRS